MTVTSLRNALHANRPFRIRTGDGKVVPVPTTDHASLSPAGRTLVVWDDAGGFELLDIPLITAVEFDQGADDFRVREKS